MPAEKSLLHPVNLPVRAVSLQRASLTGPAGRRQLAGRHIPASVLGFHGWPGNEGKEEYSLILAAARSRILQCSECLEQHLYGDAAKHLAGLIGLGIGLTPSGDDFLCGVLAGLILRGEENHPFAHALCREITSRRFDTNDISRAFLDCSVQHHFSLAVNSLTDLPSADRILNVFSDIGHSSGIDTLCGVAYGLSAEV